MIRHGNVILFRRLRHPERSRLSGGARACPEQAQRVEGDLAGNTSAPAVARFEQ